ncbi:hypothetical protein C0J52_08230 [Blattella germanica]|nr:hypothetical protein C0J52_08230 [Blattella germanica]
MPGVCKGKTRNLMRKSRHSSRLEAREYISLDMTKRVSAIRHTKAMEGLVAAEVLCTGSENGPETKIPTVRPSQCTTRETRGRDIALAS